MRKKSIKAVSLILAVITIFSVLSISGFAVNSNNDNEVSDDAATGVMRGEELIRYYRLYNGKQQYRIWSITYEMWRTDWIDC